MSHSHLLTPSESRVFNGFLTSVDRHTPNSVEWVGYSPALAEQIPHKQGKEALAQATKDLLSFSAANAPLSSKANTGRKRTGDGTAHSAGAGGGGSGNRAVSTSGSSNAASPSTGAGTTTAQWPSYVPDTAVADTRGRRSPHAPHRSQHPPSSSSFTLPPLTVPSRPHAVAPSASAPSILPGSSSKQTLPDIAGEQPSPGGSDSSGSAKRSRPAPASSASVPADAVPSTSSTKRKAAPAKKPAAPAKPALLSPSQKRANHIQSEQKRRANIRRGYESLCDAVPALREAIRAEEEAGAGAAGDDAGKARKRKRKADEDKGDGRAGPRSENVVLANTIEYIRSLLQEKHDLQARLTYARGILPPGHPVLTPAPRHVDGDGVLLWERKWDGGDGAAPDDEEGGSDDED